MTMKAYGRRTPDQERLRLLEAVAEAARADARVRGDLMDFEDKALTEFLAVFGNRMSASGRTLLEALAALEVHKEARKP